MSCCPVKVSLVIPERVHWFTRIAMDFAEGDHVYLLPTLCSSSPFLAALTKFSSSLCSLSIPLIITRERERVKGGLESFSLVSPRKKIYRRDATAERRQAWRGPPRPSPTSARSMGNRALTLSNLLAPLRGRAVEQSRSRERERERERERACVRVCVWDRERERERTQTCRDLGQGKEDSGLSCSNFGAPNGV